MYWVILVDMDCDVYDVNYDVSGKRVSRIALDGYSLFDLWKVDKWDAITIVKDRWCSWGRFAFVTGTT